MVDRRGRAILLAALIAAFALAVAPATAHEGERHPPPVTHKQDGNQSAAPNDEMPVTDTAPGEMRWPTAEDMQARAGHDERPKTFTGRVVRWLGAWHPAVVHFPVALLLTVAFLELAAAVRRRPQYAASNKTLLAIAALSAFAAAPLGWISAGLPSADDETALTIHRWLGTAMPFLLLALWAFKEPAQQAALRKTPYYEVLLPIAVLAIVVQAYFGAVVTHGQEHLAF